MIKIEIDDKKLMKKINELEANADKIAREVVVELGSIVKTNARGYVPVDTANLKESIDMQIVNNNTAEIGTNVDYGVFVEYGTTKMLPQPFLNPALQDAERLAGQVVKDVLHDNGL